MTLALLLSLVVTQSHPRFERFCSRSEQGRSSRGFPCDSYAFFEAFPSSGAGTSGACSTTAPTGSKGEVLTFTRASNGTCTKTASGGLATTGIANGDLVVLSSNQPRVEYDSEGVLGLLVESSRTNSCLRSQEIDNAAWTKYNFGSGSIPTVTANYATAPDGTMTAERVQFSAVNAGDQSGVLQAVGITTGTNAVSVYLKGTSGSGSICLSVYATGAYTTCNFVSTSWSRCTVAGAITSSGTIRIGNDSAVCGGGAMTAQDVLVWGAQFEVGNYATSYIPTTSAAATRSAESPYFTVSVPSPTYSIAASFETPYSVGSSSARVATLFQDGSHYTDDYFPTRFTAFLFDGATDSKLSSATVTTSGRVGSYFDGTNLAACVGGSCETVAAAATWTAWTRVRIGVDGVGGTAGHINGLVGRICLDPNPTRCR